MSNLEGVSKTALIAEFMATHQLSVSELRDYCNQTEKTIDVVWCIADVHQANENLDYRALSDEEAWLILSELDLSCEEVNWDSIRWQIERYVETQRGGE